QMMAKVRLQRGRRTVSLGRLTCRTLAVIGTGEAVLAASVAMIVPGLEPDAIVIANAIVLVTLAAITIIGWKLCFLRHAFVVFEANGVGVTRTLLHQAVQAERE